MAQLLFPPFFQMLDDTPVVLEGYRVFFYESGTQNKLDTFRDSTLATANTNPIVLNSEGRFPYAVFGRNQDYKIVVGLPSSEDASDPPSTIVYSQDPVRSNDLTTFMEMKVGSGAPTGSVAGTAASSGVLPTGYWDYTNNIEYRCTQTGTAATALWTALNASASEPAVPSPQGYLTPVSATPVIASNAISVTTVYYTPNVGNLVPIYNGATFTPVAFSELSLTLASQHALNTIYDIFVFNNSGVLTLVTAAAWSSSTAGSCSRGTGAGTTEISRVGGFWTNAVEITGRNGATTYTVDANLATYLGSIWVDGVAGQLTCHRSFGQSRKWGLWNAYNRKRIILQAGDATASWTHGSASLRPSNSNVANKLTTFCGLAEEIADCHFSQRMTGVSGCTIAIGYNSTTAASGRQASVQQTNEADKVIGSAEYKAAPAIGINAVTSLEAGNTGSPAPTLYGSSDHMMLSAEWLG